MFKKKKKRGDYSRREFLYLMLGGSAGLLGIGACGAAAWAMQAPARWGKELFQFYPKDLPEMDSIPLDFPDGDFFLCNTSEGLFALHRICPKEGIRVKWVHTNNRYECPKCGSKHKLSGAYIEGPVASDLNQYNVEVMITNGSRRTDNKPIPVSIADATSIVVDVRHLILGKLHP